MRLRVRFDFPKGWVQDSSNTKALAIGAAEDKSARLSLQAIARTSQSPEEYLYNYLNVGQLKDSKTIAPARLKGFSGILPGKDGAPDTRIALVYYKLNAYVFTGEVEQQSSFAETDKLFVAAINSFRPISSREIAGQKPQTVHYVKATSATTFAGLANALKLSSTDIDDLRIINGYYPSGEPKAGEWIKIFKR
jgi:predicted Zn-dependent protease